MRLLLLAHLILAIASAHDVITTKLTWSGEISRIVFRRCTSCHHEGGSTPMSLTTYESARPWAKAIRDQVLQRQMPPWGAIRGYGAVKHDPSLTQEEIMRIAEWVEGGAPEGDPKYLPSSPTSKSEANVVPAGRRIQTHRLTRNATLLGLRPLSDAPAAKIRARLPNGSEQPLLWLYGYKRSWNRTFVVEYPLPLPAGTTFISEPAVPFELLVKSPRQVR